MEAASARPAVAMSTDLECLVVPGQARQQAWVLLHGSDGRETDLLPLANSLAPHATTIAPRGPVTTELGFAHFRRNPDRSLDERDLRARVSVLADLVTRTLAELGLHLPPVVLGFSNGAIMAAALLEADPALFGTAILLRPLTPFPQDPTPSGLRTRVLVLDAEHDRRRSPGDGSTLADRLRRAGADVTHRTLPDGHPIGPDDHAAIRDWLGTPDAVTVERT